MTGREGFGPVANLVPAMAEQVVLLDALAVHLGLPASSAVVYKGSVRRGGCHRNPQGQLQGLRVFLNYAMTGCFDIM